MTYKEIVDRFKQVVTDHNQLQDFGYGNLSDIKVRSEGGVTTNTDYPYLFLNPASHSRSQQMITYTFNVIVMDMVKDDNFLKIQSDCQQYIDDVLARLRFHYTDQVDINLAGITLTPFKERFQDTVAGMTASIQLEIPKALNECIAPFEPLPYTQVKTVNGDGQGSYNGLDIEEVVCQYLENIGPWNGYAFNIESDESIQVGLQLLDFQYNPSTLTGNYIVDLNDTEVNPTPEFAVNPAVLVLDNGIIQSITPTSEIECSTPGEWIEGLRWLQSTPRNFPQTNAAMQFDTKVTTTEYFDNLQFSNWSTLWVDDLPARGTFTGTFTDYAGQFNPSEWKLAIFRASGEFIQVSNETFPAEGEEFTFTFNQFDYTSTVDNYYLTIYKVGSPTTGIPGNEFVNPFDYEGQFNLEIFV